MHRLIYIHIEKTAGTSLRQGFFLKNIKSQVHWGQRSDNCRIEIAALLGGHRGYPFYVRNNLDSSDVIYLSTVRDPIERVYSLYHYHSRRGELSGSFNEVLLRNENFQNRVFNAQNRFLSGAKHFSRTIQVLKERNYVIGTQDNVGKFRDFVQKKLGFPCNVPSKMNVSGAHYKSALHVSEDAYLKLLTLVEQDLILYRWIHEYHDGLLCTTDNDTFSSVRKQLSLLYP